MYLMKKCVSALTYLSQKQVVHSSGVALHSDLLTCHQNWKRETTGSLIFKTILLLCVSRSHQIYFIHNWIKSPSYVVSSQALYLKNPKISSWPRDQLSLLSFIMVFICTSRQISRSYHTWGHECFLPYIFKFIIHSSNCLAMLYRLHY